MAWISSGVGWSGRDALNLAAMRTRRSLPSMSAMDGWVLRAYQGAGGVADDPSWANLAFSPGSVALSDFRSVRT
jgi:hypothetical protein